MTDVVVIGGGVSGLAAAHELSCAGHEVVVLERQVRVGGKGEVLFHENYISMFDLQKRVAPDINLFGSP